MKLPRFTIAAAMFGVILVAVDLAALQYLYKPTDTFVGNSHYLVMSVLPMANVLAIAAIWCCSRGGLRRRPFLLGFSAAGLAAMLGHVAVDRMFPEAMSRLYGLPLQPFYSLTRDYFPWCIGAYPDRTAYWRYYALLGVFYCWPQFLAAGFGGLVARLVIKMSRQQSAFL